MIIYLRSVYVGYVYLINVVIKVNRVLVVEDHIGRRKDVRPAEK